MIDLNTIPAERLAMLDNAVLFRGNHTGTGGPDCKHCARELLHEIVTGVHKDETPPGVSILIGILPSLNDGPWRSDERRTEVMRPYLKKMLLLDPAKDRQRVYAVVDHMYRTAMPALCTAFGATDAATKLAALAPITDEAGALRALDALDALRALRALDALDALDALRALRALDAKIKPSDFDKSWEDGVRLVLDLICEI